MNTQPQLLRVELVGDLPVIWAFLQKIGLIEALERHFPTPLHWKGPLTPSEVLAAWLMFVISRGDHCLSHVQPWAEQHQGTLSALIGKTIRPNDFHDDRLADWLDRLADPDDWSALEQDLNRQSIRVYELPVDLIRIDMTTANSYAEVVSEQGLLQFGHSKDDPSRPQLKVATAILDPLGLPLITTVVPGNSADDPLYVPAIEAVQKSMGTGGKTYVGDCKMAAMATRAFVASSDDYYLCPLSEVQLTAQERQALLQPVWAKTQGLESVYRVPTKEGAEQELVAVGFSMDVPLSVDRDGQLVSWTERRWFVRSVSYATAQEEGLERRLAKAAAELQALPERKQGKKRLTEAALTEAAEAIVKKNNVVGLLQFTIVATTTTTQKRAYGKNPESVETTVSYSMERKRNEPAIEEAKRAMGWQVYATNALGLGLSQMVWAYRGQYRIENAWSRLKGQPLGLTPLYFQDETRIEGLVNLLSLALRVLTMVEWVAREHLRKQKATLQGVYPGQPGRKTATPTAELLLEALKTISISVVEIQGHTHNLLTTLTAIQKQLLIVWELPPDLYDNVVTGIPKPTPNTSEP